MILWGREIDNVGEMRISNWYVRYFMPSNKLNIWYRLLFKNSLEQSQISIFKIFYECTVICTANCICRHVWEWDITYINVYVQRSLQSREKDTLCPLRDACLISRMGNRFYWLRFFMTFIFSPLKFRGNYPSCTTAISFKILPNKQIIKWIWQVFTL